MTFYSADMEGATTIGEILRETRVRRGLDLVTVAEETKISSRNLQAMEDGNLASLPAEVYTRGFYTMYARMLALDPGEVLEMYTRERNKLPKTASYSTPPPNRLAQDMASMAERPTSLPSSYFGLIIFLFLLFGAFLCWYFGWNPASYLSEKLRSLEGSQRLEQVRNEESGPEFIFDAVVPEPPIKSESLSLLEFLKIRSPLLFDRNMSSMPCSWKRPRCHYRSTTSRNRPSLTKPARRSPGRPEKSLSSSCPAIPAPGSL